MSENTQTVPGTEQNESRSTTPPAPAPAKKEKSPAQLLKEQRIVDVKDALKSFPTLEAGYVTPRGVYFDEKSALASVDGDQEQVTKVQPAKK